MKTLYEQYWIYLTLHGRSLDILVDDDQRGGRSASPRGWCASMASILVFIWFPSLRILHSISCTTKKGIQTPHPADHYNVNSHPTANCFSLQHQIGQVIGCSVHYGVLDSLSRCAWCEQE